MSKQDVAVAFTLLVLLLGFGNFLFYGIFVVPPLNYPFEKAVAELNIAKTTNNLAFAATHIQEALDHLEPYHGNPGWWYPTPDTDIDNIKDIVANYLVMIEEVGDDPKSFSYQQLAHNLDFEIDDVIEKIESAQHLLFFASLQNVTLAIVWGVAAIIGLITSIALDPYGF